MKILITGATGLIGKDLGRELAKSGHEVVVVSRKPEKAHAELPFPAQIIRWAGGAETFPKEALKGVEAIFNLAGEPIADSRWTPEKKLELRDSRVLGTRSIVNAVKAGHAPQLKVFIQGSAIGIYGDRSDEVLTEASPVGEDFLALLVRDWEAELVPLESREIRIVKLRTGMVLSRHGGALQKLFPVFARGLGGKLGDGQQWMSWIHLEDIVRAFTFILEKAGASGSFNGTAPEPARNDRFSVQLARALGRSLFLPVPEVALKATMGESAVVALSSQRVLPTRLQDLGFTFKFPEIVPALEEICTPLQNGQHEILAEQWIPRKPDEIFPFFCDEKNLEALTPKFLGFSVLGKSTPEIHEGTLIDYRLSVHGVPMKWRTQIESWQPNKRFVDTQLKGPYRKWHHTHDFIPMAGGTLLRDRVLYSLPLGLFGDAVAGWKVDSDVAEIFKFRRKVINDKFGAKA